MSKKPLIPINWAQDNSAQEKTSSITMLDQSPQKIVLSENKANFKFIPKDATSPFSKSQGLMQIGGYIAVGETIEIQSNNVSITLTASVTPGSNEFYTESVAPANLPAYLELVIESIADTLNQSLSLFNNYTVQILGTTLSIVANQYGSKHDFTTFTSSTASINMFTQPGSSRYLSQDLIGYTSFANIYVGSELYGGVMDKSDATYASTKLVDSATQEANIDASIVGNYVNHILPIRNLTPFDGYAALDQGTTSGGISIPNEDPFGNVNLICRPYFIEYGDKFSYIENQTKKSYTKGVSEVRWMQLGAFDQLLPYDMQDYVWNPTNPSTFNWLTSCPNGKTVTDTSHEYLQVITQITSVNKLAFIRLFVDFYDGTTFSIDKNTFSYQDIGGNISFDVSPTAMNISGIETTQAKRVKGYRVGIVWNVSGQLYGQSDYKEYIYDRNCYNKTKNIIFVNEFGGWDSIEFRGEEKEVVDRSINTIERALPYNANTSDAVSEEVKINITTDVNSVYTLNSGLLPSNILEWSKKLDESSAVYVWDNDQSKYRNIIISETNYINDTVETGQSLSINYSYTANNNSIRR